MKVRALGMLRYNTFLSIEPLLNRVEVKQPIKDKMVDWVIIGAETGNRKAKVIPELSWIEDIVNDCHTAGIPVFIKGSLAGIWKGPLIQEFPPQLQVHRHTKHPLRDGRCSFCKREMPKKTMMALLAREKRGAAAKAIGFACPDCYAKFMATIGTDKPVKGYEINKA
jgi:hypothetical protein